MLITTSLKVAKSNQASQSIIERLAAGKHDIAWSVDCDELTGLEGVKEKIDSAASHEFRVLPLEDVVDKKDPKKLISLRRSYLTLGMNSTALLGQYFPEALDQPLQGMELLVASSNAFYEWSDKDRTNNVRASLATGKAVLEAVDVFSNFFPALQTVQPYTKVAGLALKTVESAYLVYTAHHDD